MCHESDPIPPAPAPSSSGDPFRFLVETVTDCGLVLLDPEGRITTWSGGAERLTGFAAAEVVGAWCSGIGESVPARARGLTDDARRTLADAAAHGRSQGERTLYRKDGSTFSAALTVTPFREGGVLHGYGILVTDIDVRKRAARHERELRESEARYRTFVDHATDSLILHDDQGIILDVNRQTCESLGFAREELIGKGPFDIDPDVTPTLRAERLRQLEVAGIVAFDSRHRRKDGSTFPVEVRIRRFFVDGRAYRLALSRDITFRKRAEETLRHSEERLRRAQALAKAATWSYDAASKTFSTFDDTCELLDLPSGGEPLRDLFRIIHPEDLSRVRAAWQATLDGAPYEIEHRILVRGEVRWIHQRGAPEPGPDGRVRLVTGITQDITARKKLEEQLRQSQKMEAIGQLAGGVAHDFNNLLTVINGYTELLVADLPQDSPQRRELDQIRDAGARAADLTRQLLAFSRKQISDPKVLDLNEVVAGSEKMLRRLIGEDITVSTALCPSLAPVNVDPGQIHQVLLNLAVNARDAMPKGGQLSLTTSMLHAAAADAPEITPGPAVELTVADSGIGIPDDVKDRIFEPFFTTKRVGQGTGLGLATVYGIVKQAGGHITFESAEGRGTTFRIVLPAVTEATAHAGASTRGNAPRGTETILLAEDEDAVRKLVSRILRAHGYQVLESSSAADALRVMAANPQTIHLLLTDVVMPERGGRELADAVRAERPFVKVLYMSGYTDDAMVRHGVETAADVFLQKPFTTSELARKVRGLLDSVD